MSKTGEATQKYTPTIGLEIHAELKTETKMFCSCKNDPEEKEPNVHVCPICMGHPGTLPVINKQAVANVLKVGLALGGKLADFTEFDRKNYFYPDIPKGYQLSQYKFPLVSGGNLGGVAITRVHLEEDTAKSSHESSAHGKSLVDFNRSSLPLMELVTEPVIHSAAEAGAFARELQLLLQFLDVAEANMEKGEMRVEANISVSDTPGKLGTKVEVKNLNSFRSAERAIDFEIKRHIEALERGEKIVQETRGFDENTGKTFSQRKKEDSHDYRYFPDPDLPKLKLSEIPEFAESVLRQGMPETPAQKRSRFAEKYAIKASDIEFYIQHHPELDTYFESVADRVAQSGDAKLIQTASNYIVTDLWGIVNDQQLVLKDVLWRMPAESFAAIIKMYAEGELSSRGAKDLIAALAVEGGDPVAVAETKGLIQKNDAGAIEAFAKEVIAEFPAVVAEYKGGKATSLQFLIGQGMKRSKGSANPGMLKTVFEQLLS